MRALLFFRLMVRPLAREPLRSGLTVFAVALGVGLVIAIQLASDAAAGSFHSSLESLTVKNDLLITSSGGIDERVLGRLVELPYAFDFAPRIEDFAFLNGRGPALPFLGLDLIGHRGQQPLEDASLDGTARWLSNADPIWVGTRLGLRAGDHVGLLINDAMHPFTVAGILRPQPGEIGEQNAIVADIGLAQKVTGKSGKLDSIDVRIPPTGSVDQWNNVLAAKLPASVTIEPQGARTGENRKMLAAFRWNLRILSYIALVVGGFLIYNTISISVVRRRAEIGIVRALGADRSLIKAAFLAEAGVFAALGGALGLLIGRFMALAAVQLVGNTVQSLYISSEPAPVEFTAAAIVTGLALGFLVSILAALAPAVEASRVAPVEAMARGRNEQVATARSRRTTRWALLAFLVAAMLTQLPAIEGRPLFGYLAIALLIAATAAIVPNLVVSFARTVQRPIEKILGIEALLALRSLGASLGRTSILTAALATAVAMTVSVGIMVGSFRETVRVWMETELEADFYLRPAAAPGADRHPVMSAEIAGEIERIPGVAAVERYRAYPISYDGLPAMFAGTDITAMTAQNLHFLSGENGPDILSILRTGEYAVVSEPFANKHNVHPGSMLHIPLAGGVRNFQVLGIYYDYSTERGIIVVDRRTLLKYLPDSRLSTLSVYKKPGADSNLIRQAINDIVGGRAVMVFSNGELRRGAIAVFDRTFRITYALEAVAVVVAVLGVAGALLAMVLDRRREFALVRFLGGAQPQVRRIVICEAGLLGIVSNLIGLALGAALSLILIFVINKQSFGWTIQFHWPVGLLFAALTAVYVATVSAAIYPGRAVTQMRPIEVIHEE